MKRIFSRLYSHSTLFALMSSALSTGCFASELPLDRLKLPPGFAVSIYAEVDNARQMALSENGVLYVGSRRAGKVHAVIDRDGDWRADEVIQVADGLTIPTGLAWHEGDLFVGAVSRVLRYPDIDAQLSAPPEPVVVTDTLPAERHHGWKYLKFGPDGMLYLPVGAPCNICEPDEPFASILRFDINRAEDRQIVARGVRNSVGFDWDPASGDLWFTDNGRDHLGDERPPCELNHLSEPGQHFGYPYFHGHGIADPQFGDSGQRASAYREPALALGPHTAPLGMIFYRGEQLPPKYRGDVLLAEHGSWNRSREAGPTGYRLIHAERNASGELSYEVFVDGWLNADGTRWGRPADILEMPDGSLLVADDEAGVIYRISYRGG